MRTIQSLCFALALVGLAACEDRGDDVIGEEMNAQEFPDQNRETDLEPYDDVEFGERDITELDVDVPSGAETTAPDEPQGLVPGAPGFDADPERLEERPMEEGALE